MKKFFKATLCAALCAASAFGFTACGQSDDKDVVNLVAIEATQVGVAENIDYFVVAEPAASAKVKAVDGLEFVGDLQQLYGGENGYPQAVIVAKNEIANTSFMQSFLTAVGNNAEWLSAESTSAETVVNAVRSHLTEGMAPMFTAQNLTKEVIANCGINYVSAADDKANIVSFMEKVNAVSETSFGTPSDKFFHDGAFTGEYTGTVSVYAPDGAPALGLANLLAGAETLSGAELNYEVVNAGTIQTYVAGASPKADICVLPVNAAVKVLGSGEKYKLVGTLTHGNLYMVAKGKGQINKSNLNTLKGKTVGIVNLASVPGLTFKLILKNNGIEYAEQQ